jgi:hypothetical protein
MKSSGLMPLVQMWHLRKPKSLSDLTVYSFRETKKGFFFSTNFESPSKTKIGITWLRDRCHTEYVKSKGFNI